MSSNTIVTIRHLLVKLKQNGLISQIIGGVLLILAVVALFGRIIASMMSTPSDFPLHNEIAEQMAQTGVVMTPHPLYQLLVILSHRVFPGSSWAVAAIIVTLFFYAFLSLVLYILMCYRWTATSYRSILACAFLALALLIVTPVSFFIPDGHPYLGYIAINTYHNPTIVILKPLAVLLFLYLLRAFRPQTSGGSILVVAGAGLLSVISTLAKPSYTICLLPALVVWTVVACIRKQRLDWWLLIGGIVIPAVSVLAWQYHLLYTMPRLIETSSGVVFAPFKVWSVYTSWLFFKFIFSTLFPLVVYAMYFKQAKSSLSLNLAWLVFAIGAAYTYLLAENGKRMMAGNFGSSSLITLFILFVFSTLFFVDQARRGAAADRFRELIRSKAVILCTTAFGLHFASGIVWYLRYVFTPGNPRF